MGKTMNKQLKRVLAAMICMVLLAAFVSYFKTDEVKGAQKRSVKVGFFPMDGYHEKDAEGNYGGMDVEYLAALCNYVNWDVEYIDCESWDEALRMLADKEIDLVGSAQYSKERAEIYDYANLASGYTFGSIAVEADSRVAYEDFDAMSDITFGVVSTYIRKEAFYEYLSDHGIHKPKVYEYDSTAKLYEALNNHQIDAIVHSLTEVRDGMRIVGRFAPMPIYYISYQGNNDMMRELNQGIADIKMNHPGLENELIAKHYDSRLDQTVLLTNEERQYIKERGSFTVGFLDGYYPFSYEKDGECCGLARQMLDIVAASTGMSFTYVGFETIEEALEALGNGRIDLLDYCGETKSSMEQRGISLTRSYAQVPHVIIMQRESKINKIESLAAVNGENKSKIIASVGDESMEVKPFDTQYDCLYAVKKGEADAALGDGYLAEYLLASKLTLSGLEIRNVISDTHTIYMAVGGDTPILLSILNKELMDVSDKMVSDYMLQDNFYSAVTVETFIRNHSVAIIAILAAVAAVVILVLNRMLKNSLRIQRLMYKDTELDIWNLNYLKYRAAERLASDKRTKYAVAYMDVSSFRTFKTIYGRRAGHRVLELLVSILTEETDTKTELYARSQSDHFVLFMSCDNIDTLVERLLNLENTISDRIYAEVGSRMAIVMGVYEIPAGSTDLDDAIACAMLVSDALGDSSINVVQVYDSRLSEQLKEMHDREKLLEAVDINKDFVAYYQAKVDIRDERVVGAEALVRFKDPTANGAIRAPYFFVPYYEKTSRIMEIDFFVMESVCKMLRRRIDAGKNVVPVSCNFSRLHFMGEGFFERFISIINKYQVPKDLVEVEITETLVVENMQENHIKETIEQLRRNGVRISIDDFGSGYSSLGVFEQIPASVIKLDRSFLLNNENRERQVKIMKNIVNLAHDLAAEVVCEGVENDKDKELMLEIGAFVAQGYKYAKPVSEEEFEARLSLDA